MQKRTVLRAIVSTYNESGCFRNNIIEIEIPARAAQIIMEAWNEDGQFEPQKSITAKFLASNQYATAELVIDNEIKGGMQYVNSKHTCEDEVFLFKDKSEMEDEDD